MDDATRLWLRLKAERELREARAELARIEDDLDRWIWRQMDSEWQRGFYEPSERIDYFSDLRHDARCKVRFLRSVVIELGGKVTESK